MTPTKATWKKGKKEITGTWWFNWSGDFFVIRLDKSKYTTEFRNLDFTVYDDHPVFAGWKLVKVKSKPSNLPPLPAASI